MTARLPLYLAQFLSGVVWLSLGPLLDSIMRDLSIPLAKGGLPAMAFSSGGILGLLTLNLFLAKLPVKQCLVGMAVVEAVGLTAASLLTRGLWSFVVAYFFVGYPCVVLAGIPGMWVSVHVREKTAWALNLLVLSSVTAMILAPLVLGILLGAGVNWRWIYAGEAALTLVAAAALAVLPLADIPGRENLRLRQFREVVFHNPRLLAAIVVAAFLYTGMENTLCVWLPKFEIEVFGASAAWASLAVTFYWVGQIIGRLATVSATRRMPPSSLLGVSMVVVAVFLGTLTVAPTQTISLVLSFSVGLASSGSFSHIASYSSKFSLWYAAVVFSIFQIVGGVGGMVFPCVTGWVAAAWGFRAAIGVAAAPALVVAGLALWLRRASGEGRGEVEQSG